MATIDFKTSETFRHVDKFPKRPTKISKVVFARTRKYAERRIALCTHVYEHT